MRYDKLLLKATLILATTWAIVRTMDYIIDTKLTPKYWTRVKR